MNQVSQQAIRDKQVRRWWLQELAGVQAFSIYSGDVQLENEGTEVNEVRLPLEPALVALLEKRSKGVASSRFVLLLTAVQLAAWRYSRQEELLLTVPAFSPDSGRAVPGRYVFLRARVKAEGSAVDIVQALAERIATVMAHPEGDISGLGDQLAALEAGDQAALGYLGVALGGLNAEGLDPDAFKIAVVLEQDALRVRALPGFLPGNAAECFGKSVLHLLGQFLQALRAPVSGFEVLDPSFRDLLLNGYHLNSDPYPAAKTCVDYFEAVVERLPDHPALVGQDGSLSFQALNTAANRLAHFLITEYGIGVGDHVAILLERKTSVFVAVMGILKAGAAYVPIDPALPESRKAFMITDSDARVLLCDPDNAADGELIAPGKTRLLSEAVSDQVSNPGVSIPNTAGSFVIYTSGSTGKPKGILQTHDCLTNLILWQIRKSGFEEGLRCAQFASISFDNSIQESLFAFLSGGTLYVIPELVRKNLSLLGDYVLEHKLEYVWFPVSVVNSLFERSDPKWQGHALKFIVSSGEQLNMGPRLIEFLDANPHVELQNFYGPSETHVVTWEVCSDYHRVKQLIGIPISNTQAYVLDKSYQPVPVGVPGDLYFAGPGLAHLYLNRPQLTTERFLPDPVRGVGRVYKTGDLAVWRGDGKLEYMGREDFQVKIRGFRVELGEVEKAILRHESIRECVVLAQQLSDTGEKDLVAYLVAREAVETKALREFLRGLVPEYMVPTWMVFMDQFPLNTNGKVDRRKLPDPREVKGDSESVAPRDEVERRLLAIWQSVLEGKDFGIEDDFFDLGGHSLKATQIISRVAKDFGVSLPLQDIFVHTTVASLAGQIRLAEEADAAPGFAGIPPVPAAPDFALSLAQRRMWMLNQLDKAQLAYILPGGRRISGDLDPAALEQALALLIARHEVLRTVFVLVDGVPRQRVLPELATPFDFLDLSGEADAEAIAKGHANKEATTAFDLMEGPLIRCQLIRVAPAEHIFLITLHHIISDGWSAGVLIREVFALYAALVEERQPDLRPLGIQYKDFSAWQLGQFEAGAFADQRSYWLDRFRERVPALDFPTDFARPAMASFRGGVVHYSLDASRLKRLESLCRDRDCTLFMVLAAAVKALLFRYTRQTDLVLGFPIAGRNHPDLEDQIGVYINTIALRSQFAASDRFSDLLDLVRSATLDAYANQDYPFDLLVSELDLDRQMGRSPLFDVMVILQNADGGHTGLGQFGGIELAEYHHDHVYSNFDMTFFFSEEGGELKASVEYSLDLFREDRMERMVGHLCQLLDAVCAVPEVGLSEIDFLTEAERSSLLFGWNETAADFPDQTLSGLFRMAVERDRAACALLTGGREVSYAELDALSDSVADMLRRELGELAGERIALLFAPGVEMIAAILGVLKVGAAYVPVDPDYPAERIAFILEDARVAGVLSEPERSGVRRNQSERDEEVEVQGNQSQQEKESGHTAWNKNQGEKELEVSEPEKESWAEGNGEDRFAFELKFGVQGEAQGQRGEGRESGSGDVENPAEAVAYVIYTSGTTGQPKGVEVRHRNLVRLLFNDRFPFDFHAGDTWVLAHSYCFDFSVWEIFGALLYGGRLVVPDREDVRDTHRFLALLNRFQVTILNQTPGAFRSLVAVEAGSEERVLAGTLRQVIFGGERLVVSHLQPWVERYPLAEVRLTNMYGITETTVHVTWHDVSQDEIFAAQASDLIGRPLPETRVYVLDDALQLVPAGVQGELFVGGSGVAKGYLFLPELSQTRFFEHPLLPGERIYRTGDLGRWTADGLLAYAGRADHQVKVRGYRIEPAEIEFAILQHPEVREVAVFAHAGTDGTEQLVAYFVAGEELSRKAMRLHLEPLLPTYMVPGLWVQLDAFPMTPNGKLDRKALPAPGVGKAGRGNVGHAGSGKRGFGKAGSGSGGGGQRGSGQASPDSEGAGLADRVLGVGEADGGAGSGVVGGGDGAVGVDGAAGAGDGAGIDGRGGAVFAEDSLAGKLAAIWASVLGIDLPGPEDDFFELGGHSLAGTRIITRVQRDLGIRIELHEIFLYPTIGELVEEIADRVPEAEAVFPVAPKAETYPLSHAQHRLWVLDQMETDSIVYNVPGALRLEGELDPDVFSRVIKEIVVRHEALRTRFVSVNGHPRMEIDSEPPWQFQTLYLDLRSEDDPVAVAQAHADAEALRQFDLATGPLFFCKLLQVGATDWVVLLSLHHIICDGWSMEILIQEALALYDAFNQDLASPLPPLERQYKDFAVWHQGLLASDNLAEEAHWWLDQFRDFSGPLDLPTDRPRPKIRSFRGDMVRMRFDAAQTEALKALGQDHDASLFMTLLALVNTLLFRYTGQEDIVVGSPVAGRFRTELEPLIGLFLNTLVFRTKPASALRFTDFLEQVRAFCLAAFERQTYPYDQLVSALKLPADTSRNPLFDVFVILQNADMGRRELPHYPGLSVSEFEPKHVVSKFDLTLNFIEQEDGIEGYLEYNCDLFDRERIEALGRHLVVLADLLTAEPALELGAVSLLSDSEQALLDSWGQGPELVTSGLTTVGMLDGVAGRDPAAIAVRDGDAVYSYGRLVEDSGRLAGLLADRYQLEKGQRVGLMLNPGYGLLISLLAVWRCGGVYVPVDPGHPAERKAFILQDSACAFVIEAPEPGFDADGEAEPVFPEGFRRVTFDSLMGALAELPVLDDRSALQDEAYVIYTSGTSGKPKGVLVGQDNLAAYLGAVVQTIDFSSGDVMPLLASPAFDISLFELFLPLLKGGTLMLYSRAIVRDVFNLYAALDEWTFFHGVPSLMAGLVETAEGAGRTHPHVKRLFVGGDKVPGELLLRMQAVFPSASIQVCYGPTEGTVFCSTQVYGPGEALDDRLVIGNPHPGVWLRVVDRNGMAVPVGVAGELLIGGEVVTRGYLGREELNEKVFGETGVAGISAAFYRSGDRVSWLRDGRLVFMGRIDQQVKIRGFRIEPEGIRRHILDFEGVKTAEVLPVEDQAGQLLLAAYLVFEGEGDLQALRGFLAQQLPDYMVPAFLVPLEAMPLNVNGKLDRRALPDPFGFGAAEMLAPRNQMEKELAEIWQDLLNREAVGVRDNFFESGGHSLTASRMLGQIHQRLGLRTDLRTIFLHPTIEALAAALEEAVADHFIRIPKVEAQVEYPLSAAQKRLWVLSRFEAASAAYNMPGAYELRGAVRPELFRDAFAFLISRHEILRTVFSMAGGEPVQVVLDRVPVELGYLDLRAESNGEDMARELADAESRRVFDLASGPLTALRLLRLEDERFVLLFTIHHIISDAWSMGIMLRELVSFYNGMVKGNAPVLPHLRIQYRDFSVWQGQALSGGALQGHQDYWLGQFESGIPVLKLPYDYPRPAVKGFEGAQVHLMLDAGLSEAVRGYSQDIGNSLFQTLLASVSLLLYKYSGQSDMVLGVPVSGREHPDLESQLGFFVNTLPLRLAVDGGQSFDSLLRAVAAHALEAFRFQDFPFDQLVDLLAPERDLSRSPLFDVIVSMQAQETGAGLSLEGLEVGPFDQVFPFAKYDLEFIFSDAAEGIGLHIGYDTALFSAERMARMLGHWERLITLIVHSPDLVPDGMSLVGDAEAGLLDSFQGKQLEYDAAVLSPMLFQACALDFPERIAVVSSSGNAGLPADGSGLVSDHGGSGGASVAVADIAEDEVLTYAELDARASQLGRLLMDRFGLEKGDRVALLLDRSVDLIEAMLGVVKAGGAYVPIDPAYPAERIAYILSDSGARALICGPDAVVPDAWEARSVRMDPGRRDWGGYDSDSLQVDLVPDDLAYVIYTSGSTGKPKGVAIAHRGLLNLCQWHLDAFEVDASSRATVYAGVGFDASTWEIWPYLCAGAGLAPVPEAVRLDLAGLQTFFLETEISHAFLPTNICEQFVDFSGDALPDTFWLLTGGDRLHPVSAWKGHLVNNYGPSESSVVATSRELIPADAGREVGIGGPIANLRIYMLDRGLNLQPVGVPGEICISGPSLAQGYLDTSADADRFVANPFGGVGYERLYRSGDLGMWTAEGDIRFLGRMDRQVQIRGMRVETGEIEQALLGLNGIVQSAVVVSDGRICAFVTGPAAEDQDAALTALRAVLPEFMLPDAWVALDLLPLTPNGKVDLDALGALVPEPAQADHVSASTDPEAVMLPVWASVLGKDEIGVTDDFFNLGGDSIKALQVVSRLHQLGYQVDFKDLFQHPTVQGLAPLMQPLSRLADQGPVLGEVPLTPVQVRFFKEYEVDPHHFNQSMLFRSDAGFDRDAVEGALNLLVEQHDVLRIHYAMNPQGGEERVGTFGGGASLSAELEGVEAGVGFVDGVGEGSADSEVATGGREALPVQMTGDVGLRVPLQEVDLRDRERPKAALTEVAAGLQGGFELESGPLIAAALMHLPDGDYLLIVIHHLVVDTVSWQILLDDFQLLLDQGQAGKQPALPPKTDAFQRWALHLHEVAGSGLLDEELSYWEAQAALRCAALPLDHAEGGNTEALLHEAAFELNRELTAQLLTAANQAFRTSSEELMLAALSLAFDRFLGIRQVRIHLESHGRKPFHADLDLSRTVGWFTAVYPVVLHYAADQGLARHIKELKEGLRRVPNGGIGYGVLRYLGSGLPAQEAEISFNYLGQVESGPGGGSVGMSDLDMGSPRSLRAQRPHLWDIGAIVRDGCLQGHIAFSKAQFEPKRVKGFAAAFQAALTELIAFCTGKDTEELTPTDLGYSDLSIDQLETFFD